MTHTDVVRWREQAFGSEAPWAPTLLRVPGDGAARAWTGPSMALPLLRRLGIRSTARLSRALGELRAAQRTPSTSGTAGSPGSTAIGRKRFLRIGAGVAAGGLLLAGRDIAMASGGSQERRQTYEQARAWVRANRDRLPTAYDALAERPMPYRKAIYAELSPRVRSELWTEHLDRCRDARIDLTAGQREVLRTARTMAADQTTFERGHDVDRERRMRELRESAVSAFGKDRARVG